MKVTGVVEAVGTKFNGSLLVEGKWYNYKKGVKSSAQKGDTVTLTLQEWEFNGKKGVNIVAVEAASKPAVEVVTPNPRPAIPEAPKRDFEKEARGKTLCQYIQAQLSNPGVDMNDTEAIIERAKILRDATFEE